VCRVSQDEARELLRQQRDAYKHGPGRYAREVLKREDSTIRRWLRGAPIPQAVIAFLYSKAPKRNVDPQKEAISE
jgi:hypothetical protein